MLVADIGEGIQVSDERTPFRLPSNALEFFLLDLLEFSNRLYPTSGCLVPCSTSDNPQILSL